MKKLAICFCFFLPAWALAQHSSIYSQYIFNALVINPAYAGSQNALDVTALYRNQWLGIDGAPRTISFAAHSPLRNTHHNIGLSFVNDQFGITKHNKINAVYSYKIKLSKGFLSLGLQAGADFTQQNWSLIRTVRTDDPAFNYSQNYVLPQAGFGLYYQARRFFAGLSAPSFLDGRNLSAFFPVMFYTGGLIRLGENFRLKPTVLIKYLKDSPVQTDLNLTLYIKDIIGVGAGYRLNDAALFFFDLRVNDQLRLGYCYDYTVSALRNYTSGSHEVMIRYLFSFKSRSQSSRYF